MNFGTTLLGITNNLNGRYRNTLLLLDLAVLRDAVRKLHQVLFSVAANSELQALGKCIDAGNTDTVQTTRHLVSVLIKLTACVQLGHDDFRRAALGLVFIVPFDPGRYAAAVIGNRD